METKDTHTNVNLAYAVQLVHATCCLAGSASYLEDIRADLRWHGIVRAIRDHDTPALFDWLIEIAELSGNLRFSRFRIHSPVRHRPMVRHCRCLVAKTIVPKARRVLAVLRLPIP